MRKCSNGLSASGRITCQSTRNESGRHRDKNLKWSNLLMATISEQIRGLALDLLKERPEGLRFGQLVAQIHEKNNSFNRNTINGSIWDLDTQFPDRVYKPSRGLFRLLEFKDPK